MPDLRVARAKLRPPRLPASAVERPRLTAALDNGLDTDVILVAAPAGYGKTTAVCHWLLHQTLPSAWLTLDHGDDDPWVLASCLIAAVRTVYPDSFQWFTDASTGRGVLLIDAMVNQLTDELGELDEFVLVLDDCDSLRRQGGLVVLDRLVRRMPQSVHLVLLCRRDPPLPLGLLRGRGQLTELRVRDLRFDAEEAGRLLERSTGSLISPDAVRSLVDKTEGWIAGLHLAALSVRGQGDLEGLIRRFTGSDRYVADYLMEGVIARLPEHVQGFLFATSILERLCSSLCRAVMGGDAPDTMDGQPMLEWLERENLFVLSIGEERIWFRYHKLFQELLRHRLQATHSTSEISELHRRAGAWLAGDGQVDAALDHLLAAGDVAGASELVSSQAAPAVDEERWNDLERWIRLLPRDAVEKEPRLLVAEAWIFQTRLAWDDLARTLDTAGAALRSMPSLPERAWLQSDMDALRSWWLYWQGDGRGALDYAMRAMDQSRPARSQARAVAQTMVAGSLQLQGDTGAARRSYRQLLEGPDGGTFPPRGLVGLGLVELIAGDLTAASDVADTMMARARPLGLTDSMGWSHYLQAVVAYQRDQLDVAEEHLTAVTSRPLGIHIVPVKESFFGLALLHSARGESEKSAMVADHAVAVLTSTGNPALVAQVRSLQVRLELLARRQVALPDWLDAFGELPEVFGLGIIYEYPPLTLAQVLIADGAEAHLDRAASILSRLAEAAERGANTYRLIQVKCLEALLHDARGDAHAALESLATAVDLGRPGGFVRMYADFSGSMPPLLERLLVAGRRDDHVRRLIAASSAAREARHHTADRLPAGSTDGLDAHAVAHRVASQLTNRELDVLVLLDKRLTNKEIARRLYISPATVKRHTLSVYRKLGVNGRREASMMARELGILPLP